MTEFGRGYATCLFLFLGHTRRLSSDLAIYRSLRDGDGKDYFSDARAVEMWANGAGDHLADLIMPRRGVTADEKHRAKAVAGRVWTSGRTYTGQGIMRPDEARASIKEAQRLLCLAAKAAGVRYPRRVAEAVAIDNALGLTRANPGGYTSCFRKNPAR